MGNAPVTEEVSQLPQRSAGDEVSDGAADDDRDVGDREAGGVDGRVSLVQQRLK